MSAYPGKNQTKGEKSPLRPTVLYTHLFLMGNLREMKIMMGSVMQGWSGVAWVNPYGVRERDLDKGPLCLALFGDKKKDKW